MWVFNSVSFDRDTVRIVWPRGKGRTKHEILTDRLSVLKLEVESLERELSGMVSTPCGLKCSGCGEMLDTEADFAKHFIVSDEAYLNLGGCPNRK